MDNKRSTGRTTVGLRGDNDAHPIIKKERSYGFSINQEQCMPATHAHTSRLLGVGKNMKEVAIVMKFSEMESCSSSPAEENNSVGKRMVEECLHD